MAGRKKHILVVTGDAGAARFFECAHIGGPMAELADQAMHAEPPRPAPRPPRVHDRFGPGRHIIEARESPRDAAERVFLERVAARIDDDLDRFDEVVMCLPPRPLGILRGLLSKKANARVRAEVAKDYPHESTNGLAEKLRRAVS